MDSCRRRMKYAIRTSPAGQDRANRQQEREDIKFARQLEEEDLKSERKMPRRKEDKG